MTQAIKPTSAVSTELTTDYLSECGDDHELTKLSQQYGEWVVHSDEWDIDLDLTKVVWETSVTAKRQHGVAKYRDGTTRIRISQHTYERADFEACKDTIRHELVHAWQYQHRGEIKELDGHRIKIEAGHGDSFKHFCEILNLSGRCSNHYQQAKSDYKYILECDCNWIGRHRKSKIVKSADPDHAQPNVYYCTNCEEKYELVEAN